MKKALNFLRNHWDVALATVGEDNKPKVRAFQIMRVEGSTIYFATSEHKEVCEQLHNNPYLEILAMDSRVSVRISGRASFDISDEMAQSIYNGNAILQALYDDYQSLSYFAMSMEKVEYYDLTVTPPLYETHCF